MSSINDAFPSAFLKCEDLQGRNVPVTIASAKIEEVGQGKDRKIVISLLGKSKKFVCNKTNAKVIAGLHGDQLEGWTGKQIILCPREVEFQGSMVWAIRVSLQRPGAQPIGTPVQSIAPPAQTPPARRQPANEDEAANLQPAGPGDGEDVPFN